jgi:two-component system OmpR family response regulator
VGDIRTFPGGVTESRERRPIRVLLLDDLEENLLLRSTILRQKGYEVVTAASVDEAKAKIDDIDIAVLDYHLGAGKFGTDVADTLREKRPEVPIIILSATLERHFGGIADMHLLKGYSSVDDLVSALRSFEAKRRGKPVVVEVLDRDGCWQYVNNYFAALHHKKRPWFPGKNLFEDLGEVEKEVEAEWRDIIRNVTDSHETYIDRRGRRGVPHLPTDSPHWDWNVLVFPIRLHDGREGLVLAARLIQRR